MKKMAANNTVTIDWKPNRDSEVPMYIQIVNYVRSKISNGDWVIGNQLPSQRTLSEMFEVNRSTIVTAMDELMSYGLIESGYGGGTKISSNTWSSLMSEQHTDWNKYIKSGMFQSNQPTIQTINKLEFDNYIRLGTGELSPGLFPNEMMNTVLGRLTNRINSLNYLEPLGLLELRQLISKRLLVQGINVPPSCILITSGSLQALQLISICMLKQGSTIYTEAPTYLKSLQVFQSAGMNLSGVPMDDEGIKYWMIDALNRESKLQTGNRLLYTIPTFQNPTGILMSEKRRRNMLEFCKNCRLPIIEDTAYSELWLEDIPPLPLKSNDTSGMVLYIGTVSKTLAPGLRVGWIVGSEAVINRLGDVKMQIDYGASSLSQWALAEFFETGLYDEYLVNLRKVLKMRRDNALKVLDDYFSDLAEWNVPAGGFYIWLKLKKDISIGRLFRETLKHNIILNPGNVYDFYQNHCLRISYAYEENDTFRDAMKKLREIILKEM